MKSEQWWAKKLDTVAMVWPILHLLRLGERTDNSRGESLNAMIEAEAKLDSIIASEPVGSIRRNLASDVLIAINTQGNGDRHWDQCKTPALYAAMCPDPTSHGDSLAEAWCNGAHRRGTRDAHVRGHPRRAARGQAGIRDAGSADFFLQEHANHYVWKNADVANPCLWWGQWGPNDMPNAAHYIVWLQGCRPNRSAAERYFKLYKNTVSKERTRMGQFSATQFCSDDDEFETTGTRTAALFARLNSREEWQDPSETMTIDDKSYSITDLDAKDWAGQFGPA